MTKYGYSQGIIFSVVRGGYRRATTDSRPKCDASRASGYTVMLGATCMCGREQSCYRPNYAADSRERDFRAFPQMACVVANLDPHRRRVRPSVRNISDADLTIWNRDLLLKLIASVALHSTSLIVALNH